MPVGKVDTSSVVDGVRIMAVRTLLPDASIDRAVASSFGMAGVGATLDPLPGTDDGNNALVDHFTRHETEHSDLY